MPTYNTGITRTGTPGTSDDPLVPRPLAQELIREATKRSAVMQMVNPIQMPATTHRIPVLGSKAVAYWGSGDNGLAQTSAVGWTDEELIAEPLSVIVTIPKDYLSDAIVDIWPIVRDELAEAVARKIDAACLFGTDAPSTFGDSVVEAAQAVSNEVAAGTGDDLGVDIASLAQLIKKQGYTVGGFVTEPGFDFDLYGIRSTDGVPIYQALQDSPGGRILGRSSLECDNGAFDATTAVLIAGDWSKAKLGIRQDITWEVSDTATISDGNGAITQNLWQQHMVGLKLHARYAWTTVKPVTALEDSALERSPFGILTPGT